MGGYAPPKNPRNCDLCGKLFQRKSGNGKYCVSCRHVKLRQWMNESISRNRDHYRAKNRREALKLRRKLRLAVIGHYSGKNLSVLVAGILSGMP